MITKTAKLTASVIGDKINSSVQDFFSGGKATKAKFKFDVDQHELNMGKKVEMEHTTNKTIATRIALDHLEEEPKYYTGLKLMEDILKKPQGLEKLKQLGKSVG